MRIYKIKASAKLHNGGYRYGSGRGKQGWYKEYWCDSSWELAYVIYNLEHDIKFVRNKEGFEYEFENKKYKYYPDFILEDGTYVEIKGYFDKKNEIKIKSFDKKLIVIDKKGIQQYIDYVIKKYGKDYIKLYDDYKHIETKIPCPQCGKLMLKTSKVCAFCSRENSKKLSKKPNKEILIRQLIENNLSKVAKLYNVSHTTIRRWCKQYNINFKNLIWGSMSSRSSD